MSTCPASSSVDCDWYGNASIHHLMGYRYPDSPNIPAMITLLQMNPHAACATNQFKRLPLHYALDRCKPDFEVVQILCESYPEGVTYRDNDNESPFDIAIKWKHPIQVMKLLLKTNPEVSRVYPTLCLHLTYGTLLGTMIGYLMGLQLMRGIDTTRIEQHDGGQVRYINTRSINPTAGNDDDDDDDNSMIDRSPTDNNTVSTIEDNEEYDEV